MFEDVHWSDPTTRESLDLLSIGSRRCGVLVIITFRPEFTPPWIGRPHVTMLILNRLPPRQRAEMIPTDRRQGMPKEIADQIVDRTDGVPLFIEELTKSVVESGIVTEPETATRRRDRWRPSQSRHRFTLRCCLGSTVWRRRARSPRSGRRWDGVLTRAYQRRRSDAAAASR